MHMTKTGCNILIAATVHDVGIKRQTMSSEITPNFNSALFTPILKFWDKLYVFV